MDVKDTTFGASDDWGKQFEAWYGCEEVDGMLMVTLSRFCRNVIEEKLFIMIMESSESKRSGSEDFVNMLCCSLRPRSCGLICLPLCVHSAKIFNLVRFWHDDCYLK